MISMVGGNVNAYALNNLQERGIMFVEPGEPVYEGQVVAENARDNDMTVNPTTAKKLTNMRTTSSDENIILKPARKMTLEQALEYIEEDELVEVTPNSIRLRKELLTENERKKAGRKKVVAEVVEV
jgi:GTP-binding protein